MHNAAQFELDAPADRQPMQLEKTWSDVLPWTQLEDQACRDSYADQPMNAFVAINLRVMAVLRTA